MASDDLQIGQRYRDAYPSTFGTPTRVTWVLDALWQAADGIPHVRLIKEDDRSRKKTVSAIVLKDRRRFIRI